MKEKTSWYHANVWIEEHLAGYCLSWMIRLIIHPAVLAGYIPLLFEDNIELCCCKRLRCICMEYVWDRQFPLGWCTACEYIMCYRWWMCFILWLRLPPDFSCIIKIEDNGYVPLWAQQLILFAIYWKMMYHESNIKYLASPIDLMQTIQSSL